MRAAALRIDLRIPGAQSLKEKRSVVRPLVEGLRRVASISVSEVGHHDAWQRCVLGVAMVAPDPAKLERLLAAVQAHLDSYAEVEVVSIDLSHLEDPE